MSLDDRIRQLSETIIHEVRGPLESALHVLLSDVMRVAAEDRDQVVQSALSTSAAGHEAALAVFREQADRERAEALALAREQVDHEQQATTASVREQLEREHDEKLAALRQQLDREREEQLTALRETLEREHDETLAALHTERASEHETALARLRAELTTEHETAVVGLRAELASEHETAVAGLRDELTTEHETAVAGLRDELAREHDAGAAALREQLAQERDAAIASVREQLDQERESALANLRAELEQERDAAAAGLRDELAREHEAALEAALQAVCDEAARAQSELATRGAQAAAEHESALQAVRDELGRSHDEALTALRNELTTQHDDAAATVRRETAAEVAGGAALTVALAQAEHGKHEAEARVAVLQQELDQARADVVQARADVVQARDAKAEAEQNLGLVHVADRQQELACSDRTLASFRRLDEARSLTDVLCILADQAAVEIGRVAVLVVNGFRLRGWETRGLPGVEPAAIDAPIEAGSVFGIAIATGLPVSTSDAPIGLEGNSLAGLLAAPPGRAGLAVPISVGGRVVALLYADDAGDRVPVVPSSWPEIAEILARHAGHRLEVLTMSHAAILAGRVQREQTPTAVRPPEGSPYADDRREEESARRYARLLISEIKLYNETAVDLGRQERNLLERLGPDIERARRLYEEKIPAAVRRRVDCFDEEVVRTLAGGDPGSLG